MFVCSLRSHHCFEEVLGLFCIKVLQVCCCSQVSANRAINRQTLATSEVLPMLTAISAIVEETTEDASAFLRLGVLNSHAGRTVPGRFLDFARRRLKSQKKLRYREAHMQANSMKSCSIRGQVAFTVQIRLYFSPRTSADMLEASRPGLWVLAVNRTPPCPSTAHLFRARGQSLAVKSHVAPEAADNRTPPRTVRGQVKTCSSRLRLALVAPLPQHSLDQQCSPAAPLKLPRPVFSHREMPGQCA